MVVLLDPLSFQATAWMARQSESSYTFALACLVSQTGIKSELFQNHFSPHTIIITQELRFTLLAPLQATSSLIILLLTHSHHALCYPGRHCCHRNGFSYPSTPIRLNTLPCESQKPSHPQLPLADTYTCPKSVCHDHPDACQQCRCTYKFGPC